MVWKITTFELDTLERKCYGKFPSFETAMEHIKAEIAKYKEENEKPMVLELNTDAPDNHKRYILQNSKVTTRLLILGEQ
jgi:hypothetical protein